MSRELKDDSLLPEEYKIVETIYDIDDDEPDAIMNDLMSLDKNVMHKYRKKKFRGSGNDGQHYHMETSFHQDSFGPGQEESAFFDFDYTPDQHH